MTANSSFKGLQKNLKILLRDACRTSFDLFRITVPISILTKILNDIGATEVLGQMLGPVMKIVGLPGSMGLVWATAMLTNLYGGMVVFASLAPQAGLSIAQVTVLTTMMLVAHSLPVELKISQKAGPRFRAMVVLRIAGALVLGWVLFRLYLFLGYLQAPNRSLWVPPPGDPSWIGWFQGEFRNILFIFLIIFFLLAMMRILERWGVMNWLNRQLEPLLRLLGMSPKAAPITVIGMTLGLSYGGALIIQDARSGRLESKDVFISLALMGLCHGIVEDTLVMMLLGGHLSGILWARLIFSLAVVYLLGKGVRRLSEQNFYRYLFRKEERTTFS